MSSPFLNANLLRVGRGDLTYGILGRFSNKKYRFTEFLTAAPTLFLFLFPEHCDDFGDEQGEDKKTDREKDFKGDEISPASAGPNFFEGADEESKNERSYDNA
jgi:hypothetical protein